MSHSHVEILVHVGWTTKHRSTLLRGANRSRIALHLREKAAEPGIAIHACHVQPDHVHLLLDLPRSVCIDDAVRTLKGESSHWINQEGLMDMHFSWQTGYGAFSVGPADRDVVRRYIENQDEHHSGGMDPHS